MALRLTQKDKDKLKRINSNVRAKNNRLRNYGVNDILPTLNIKDVKSRKQLNNYYDLARQYTRGYGNRYIKVDSYKNDNPYALRLSDVTQARRLAREISKERARRFDKYKDLIFKTRGRPTSSTVLQRQLMGDDRYDMFRPIKVNLKSFRSEKDFQNRLNTLVKMSSKDYINEMNSRLRENIKIAIDNNWGKDGENAKRLIDNMSDEEFLNEYITEDIFAFEYIYDPNQRERKIEQFEATLLEKGY